MAVSSINTVEILRCLRHSYESLGLFISSLARLMSWPAVVQSQPSRDNTIMNDQSVWRKRLITVAGKSLESLWIFIIYLLSELIVWGLSRAFAPAKLEFFSSICGMVFIFAIMTSLCLWFRTIDDIYSEYVKPKIDFLNSHLGIGFPIPLIMLNKEEILKSHDIGRIIGNFVITNLASWTLVFVISLFIMTISTCQIARLSHSFNSHPIMRIPFPINIYSPFKSMFKHITAVAIERNRSPRSANPNPEAESCFGEPTRRVSVDEIGKDKISASSLWNGFTSLFPLLASFFCIFVIGAPVAATFKEERVLDGCVLWFIWVLTTRLQRGSHQSHYTLLPLRLKNAAVTLMNPVLTTTFLMTAYTRAKASAYGNGRLSDVLDAFSGGTPLYTLWTSSLTSTALPSGVSSRFGAGDAALSILECGIVIWGFKLYECQRQVFSIAGLLTILISTLTAAGSVFLSVLSGRIIGLDTPEALSFAARSTTLALAKPAIEAVGGNRGVNAALVVSNGILGQLVYPFALSKLDVRTNSALLEAEEESAECTKANTEQLMCGDSPATIAAGVAIGINGAAMGVSYLYETRSRSAPYAALAMTVFGIMTVIFTTMEPFRRVVVELANR